MRAAMGRHLACLAIMRTFAERYPEMGRHLVHRDPRADGTPEKLTLDASDAGRVELTSVRVDYPGMSYPCWLLSGPEGERPIALWDAVTSDEVIADALHERARAAVEERPEASPWRWDEAAVSDITRLADALTSQGVAVDYAVADNRHRVVFGTHGFDFRRHLSEGDLLLVRVSDLQMWVYRRPGLGWLVDVHAPTRRRVWRIDLTAELFGSPGTVPGLPADRVSVDELAGALVGVIKGLEDGPPSTVALYSGDGTIDGSKDAMLPPETIGRSIEPQNPSAVVAAQLNAFGFGDVRLTEAGTELVSAEFQVVRWQRARPLGLPDLKKLYADAAVEGKRLLVLADHGLTDPAEEFADRSRSFVFSFDPRRARVFSGNQQASEARFVDDHRLRW